MLILPNRLKILEPIPSLQWRDPSQAQWKDQRGNPGVQTRFRLTARLHDGFAKWRLWFDSRDDADQFLFSLGDYIINGVPIPREDWHLPNEIWGDPQLYPELQYDFATVTFLTTTGSNQTYNKPSDWVDSGSIIEGIGGGGSGDAARNSVGSKHTAGAGGGEYAKIINFAFSGGSLTYRVGSGAAGVNSTASNGVVAGSSGTVTYFNASSDPGTGADNTKLGAKPGLVGSSNNTTGGVATGGAGGTGGWGTTKNAGGRGGNADDDGGSGPGQSQATGGGGAAGPNGTGGNGEDSVNIDTDGTDGGTGDGGNAAAGVGSGTSSAADGTDGANGTAWDASHGSGGGGGGGGGASQVGGDGGNYGGGGGACRCSSGSCVSGSGIQGLIVVSYTPVTTKAGLFLTF